MGHGRGVIFTRHYRFVGVFDQGVAKGDGKYVLSKGLAQHGRYVVVKTVRTTLPQEEVEEQLRVLHVEDEGDDEVEIHIDSRWKPKKLNYKNRNKSKKARALNYH